MPTPGTTQRNEAQKHASLLRQQAIVELRLKHPQWGYRRLGEEIGVTHTTARRLWIKAMDAATAEMTEEAKHAVVVELRRLDALWELNYQRATSDRIDIGEQQAATDRCLKISQQRAKLLGLEAPERLEVTGAGGGPIVFQEILALEGPELDAELAGFFNPGYMEGAADGYERGLEDGRKEAKKKPAKKKKVKETAEEYAEEEQAPVADGGQGQARTGSTVVIANGSQGRARLS